MLASRYSKQICRWALCLVSVLLLGCDSSIQPGQSELRIATTTSTRDSGLLDVLLPEFTKICDCDLSVIAAGTGAALKLGQQGEVDVLIVHAPNAEAAFMKDKHGSQHSPFMKNSFVLLGHPDMAMNPQKLTVTQAMAKIADNRLRFVSRGDDSGTHKKELELWGLSASQPQTEAYTETGQGMGNTLMIANELKAFTLCDAGTYLQFKNKIDLRPVNTEGAELENRYSVITVQPEKNNYINQKAAREFYDFLNSKRAAALIRDFQVNGQTLFTPLNQ